MSSKVAKPITVAERTMNLVRSMAIHAGRTKIKADCYSNNSTTLL
ncbi:hypothetical protein [Nostoc punctiforme]|nr:hypothetical protein [Nostoc punctiforme]